MSQERTRFPIQPQDVRRSAKSSRDVSVAGDPPRRGGPRTARDQDKPPIPPDRRGHPRPQEEIEPEG